MTLISLGEDDDKRNKSWAPVGEETVLAALERIVDSAHYPVLITCNTGKHRTGEKELLLIVAHVVPQADRYFVTPLATRYLPPPCASPGSHDFHCVSGTFGIKCGSPDLFLSMPALFLTESTLSARACFDAGQLARDGTVTVLALISARCF